MCFLLERVAMRSTQSNGMIPKRARNPVWGTRYGTDIITANSSTRPHSIIFSFFILYLVLAAAKI